MRSALIALAAAAALLGTGALALGDRDDEAVAPAYGVFDAPARAEDRPSAELRSKLERLDVVQVRLAVASPRLYATKRADGSVCLVDATGAGGCLDAASPWGMVGIDECEPADEVLVYGLVPDGVAVELGSPDGGSTPVDVERNGWSASVPRARGERPTHVITSTESDSRRLELGYSTHIDEGCGPRP
jgi:hypothetical protein